MACNMNEISTLSTGPYTGAFFQR